MELLPMLFIVLFCALAVIANDQPNNRLEQNGWVRIKRDWYNRGYGYGRGSRRWGGRYGGGYGRPPYGGQPPYGPRGRYGGGMPQGNTDVNTMDIYSLNLFGNKAKQGDAAKQAQATADRYGQTAQNYPSIFGGGGIGNMKVL
ncbi:unnamed protein product, partial [Anisakis simplex]|uniref:Uncharacterized protein n=1 Tax=Anisakis simplex TaxID=6269 RepID=A0A0M3JDV4_ANISI